MALMTPGGELALHVLAERARPAGDLGAVLQELLAILKTVAARVHQSKS